MKYSMPCPHCGKGNVEVPDTYTYMLDHVRLNPGCRLKDMPHKGINKATAHARAKALTEAGMLRKEGVTYFFESSTAKEAINMNKGRSATF